MLERVDSLIEPLLIVFSGVIVGGHRDRDVPANLQTQQVVSQPKR